MIDALVRVQNKTFFQIKFFLATELVILLLQFYEANYPEILKVCFIINGK